MDRRPQGARLLRLRDQLPDRPDHAIIVDVEATPRNPPGRGRSRPHDDRSAQERFGLYPERLVADSAYGSAQMLGWLVEERGIEPHIPVFDKSARSDGPSNATDFTYDREDDVYICPAGKMLTHATGTLVNRRRDA